MNQTNIYGYDLTTSLRNVARMTPSTKFSELLTGMSITINSGGDIKSFLEKRSESLLLEYRLEREKFTKVAETFMDIYISIVIATPMILLLLLVMIAVSGIQIGLSINDLTIAIIGLVAMVNVLFLTFLHLKQPGY
ncbi:MAG: type II secretion system F family protein [Bacteroidetes bacterium]|nr:type II secretion system F family protein [Bacteroidota bacterium]